MQVQAVPGHWEGDLILGLGSSAIGTLVKRKTRFALLLQLPRIEGHGKTGSPVAAWQRGSIENTNGLLRQYFRKGTDLSLHGVDELSAVAHVPNSRPRKTLGWRTPAEAFEDVVKHAN